jgi:polysaccharide biosynthesis transport protein
MGNVMEEELEPTHELPDFAEIKGMVRRRRWQFLVPFFCGWLLVWAASWVIPSTYRSTTLILVEQPSIPEKYVVSNIDTDIQRQLDSITQQILSRTRLLRIIDSLGLYANERHRKTPDDLVEKMRKDIEIELSHGDDQKLSAFYINYINRDPKLAQAATSELANLFITENLEQRETQSVNTTNFLEQQLEEARAKLATQEAKLREFKDQHLGELPTQTQSNLQILAGLQSQLQQNQDALNRARQQNTYLVSLINQYKAMGSVGKSGAADDGPGGLAEADKELDQLKAQLADLTSHYTDKHPDVRKTREQIAKVEKRRERIVAEMNAPHPMTNTDTTAAAAADALDPKNAPFLELQSQLKANQLEIVNRENDIKDEQNKINQYQGRLNMAPVMEQQFADITRDYDQSKTDYESLLSKKNESERSTELEKTQQGEHFRMLDPPNLPIRPYKPNRLMLCGAGLAVGLVFGGGFAFAKEKLGGTFYSEREIKKALPFEVIAEIPPIESVAEQSAHKRSAWMAVAVAVVIVGFILLGSAVTYLYG